MQYSIKKIVENPLIVTTDVVPSIPGFRVDGVFNCGVTRYGSEIILLCRVAESVISDDPDVYKIPIMASDNGNSRFGVTNIRRSEHPEYNYDDSRVLTKDDGNGLKKVVSLTSLSHFRVARSIDGVKFELGTRPAILPDPETECWGMEDPRITKIENTYYINYTAVSPNGAATALIKTMDFISYERLGLIFLPENKDVCIFPKKIGGKYYAFNRPVPNAFGTPDIWISESEDLLHWGMHRHFYGVSDNGWENGRVGGGAVPFLTEKGWIAIYHAADTNNRYCLGAFLLSENNPDILIAKTKKPLVEPGEIYETQGFFPQVVFTGGCLYENGLVKVYYGAADDKICRVDIPIEHIYRSLGV